jgi:hypothetical protein
MASISSKLFGKDGIAVAKFAKLSQSHQSSLLL